MAWSGRFEDNSLSVNINSANGAVVMFNLKRALKARGWTVPRSSDGTTYNSSGDQITTNTTGAGGMNNNNAWYVVRMPDGTGELCIQRTTAATVWRIKWSRAARFTTGGSATVVSSASDEKLVCGAGTDAAPTGRTLFNATANLTHIMTQDVFPYCFWVGGWEAGTPGTKNKGFFLDYSINKESSDPDGYLHYWHGASALTNAWASTGLSTLSTASMSATIYAGTGSETFATHGDISGAMSTLAIFPGTAGSSYVGQDTVTSKTPLYRVASVTAQVAGGAGNSVSITAGNGRVFGHSTFRRWNVRGATSSHTYNVNTTRDYVVMGVNVLPWEAGITPTDEVGNGAAELFESGTPPDSTAPTVNAVTPTSGTTLATSTTPVGFNLYDADPGLASYTVWLVRGGESRPYMVHDGTSFQAPFTGGSKTGSGTSGDPYVFSFYPTGGWWSAISITLYVKATDTDGNVNTYATPIGNWTTADGQIYLANNPLNTGMQTP